MLRGMQSVGWKAVVAMAGALVLAGCAATPDPEVPTSKAAATSSANPAVIAAAAKHQYLLYFKASGDVLRDGGKKPERIRPFVTAAEYKTESADLAAFRAAGRHLVGRTSTRNFTLQSADSSAATITAYVCVDNGKSRIQNKVGQDVTPSHRAPRTTLLLTFDTSRDHPLLAKSIAWTGSSVC